MLRKEIKKVLEETNYRYYGIRGIDYNEVEIGEILEVSYDWDIDIDESTYGTDNETELGGVSVTLVKKDLENSGPYWDFDNEFETLEEKIEGIIETINWHKRNYSYKNAYLVGSDKKGYGDANDENEYILEDAIVLLKVR